MPYVRQSLRASFLATLVFMTACRGGSSDDGGATKATVPTAPAAAAPAAPAPDPEIIAPADVAANVSGAFLTACSMDTSTSFVNKENESQGVAACVLQNAASEVADVENVVIEAVRIDGSRYFPEVVAKEVMLTPWHAGVRVPNDEVTKLASFDVTYNETGKTPAVATTADFYYDWPSDPTFDTIISLIRQLSRPVKKWKFDLWSNIQIHVANGRPFHFRFVTDDRYDGNLGGLAGADAKCTAAGQTLFPGRKFQAILSDAKSAAVDRIEVEGRILDYSGEDHPGDSLFDSLTHYWTFAVTERGNDAGSLIEGTDSQQFNYYAWSGSRDDGTQAPGGSFCQDWTTNASTILGFIGLTEEPKKWLELKPWPCSKGARLYCISEFSASAPVSPAQ